jgi:hypothetical protein
MELAKIVEGAKEQVTDKIRKKKSENVKLAEGSPGAMEVDQDSKPKSKREGDTEKTRQKSLRQGLC